MPIDATHDPLDIRNILLARARVVTHDDGNARLDCGSVHRRRVRSCENEEKCGDSRSDSHDVLLTRARRSGVIVGRRLAVSL
jgi:hypothetical protein